MNDLGTLLVWSALQATLLALAAAAVYPFAARRRPAAGAAVAAGALGGAVVLMLLALCPLPAWWDWRAPVPVAPPQAARVDAPAAAEPPSAAGGDARGRRRAARPGRWVSRGSPGTARPARSPRSQIDPKADGRLRRSSSWPAPRSACCASAAACGPCPTCAAAAGWSLTNPFLTGCDNYERK